jgi:hypothetical protein
MSTGRCDSLFEALHAGLCALLSGGRGVGGIGKTAGAERCVFFAKAGAKNDRRMYWLWEKHTACETSK